MVRSGERRGLDPSYIHLGKPQGLWVILPEMGTVCPGQGGSVSVCRSLPSWGMSKELVRFGDFQGITGGGWGEQ
jgi:hypothetical protein